MTTPTTTITSLLDSLHTHLQSQTQLLPTLHNQLGLPQTALADDLSALQKQLTECVESQIDLRRKQVDEWMGRCDAVERECVRYTKALGGHVKATGSSVGELRKEQVLPKRFEMITEYQEKLRQLYHTKLEQLTTLTNRITALARTLGPDYFSSDVLDPFPATGESEADPDARRDVTPERFTRLEKEVVRGKSEVGKRLHHLSLTFAQIDWLYAELGMTPPSPTDSASSSSTSSRPQSACSIRVTGSSSAADPFLSSSNNLATPTPAGSRSKANTPFILSMPSDDASSSPNHESEYYNIYTQFISRLDELGEEAVTDPNKPSVGLEGVDPSPELIQWAESTQANLEDTKRRRESHIQAMYDQLESLWRRLGVTDAEMDEFVEANRGSTEATVRAYEEELDRMLELKREKMGTFIENARLEITKLWDELMVGEEERAEFAPFADDEHSEELLAIHEEEIRRLKEERKLKGTLLKNIQKYFDICQDEKDLAAAAADQTRLLGRGPRDPGRLLREEKMRKRVTKEKPRLEQDLLNSIPAWEAQTGKVFLVHGRSILQILQEASQAQEKENGTKRGKTRTASGSVPRSKTPSYAPSSSASSSSKAGSTSTAPARPPSASGRTTRSASASAARRPKLGEAASTTTNNHASNALPQLPVPIVPMSTSRSTRAPSPALHVPAAAAHGRTPAAQPTPLPRPQGLAASKRGTPMTGRVGSATKLKARSYHPYTRPTKPRSASAQPPPTVRVYGAVGLNSVGAAPAASTARKPSARRESFRPRASVDEDWTGGASTADKRFAGFAGGMVQEEDEDF